jgi:putative membrane protein
MIATFFLYLTGSAANAQMMEGIRGHRWGMGWWWLIGIIVLIAIIWPLSSWARRKNITSEKPQKTALDILKERYAKGEIDKEEFEERKEDL